MVGRYEQRHVRSIEESVSHPAPLERASAVVCSVAWSQASCSLLPICSGYGSACAQCPAMPEPVDGEHLLADNMESGSCTERPRLRKRIGASMSPLNPPHQPLKHRPEPCGPTPCEIFYHHLPARSQQPSPSRKERRRVCHVVQRVGAGDQVKGARWVR